MPTRISGACNGCRSKKQKCSGDKSGCAQCEAAGITCTWPEQRKRGPAKGYIEGLEHRLHEAESLLLQVLPHISSEQLQAATISLANNDSEDIGRGSPDRRGSPPVLNKKTGIEYWENFPLTSVDSIRRWQQDCEINSVSSISNPNTSTSNLNRSSTIKSEGRNASPHSLSGDAQSSRRKRQSIPNQQQQQRSMGSYSGGGGNDTNAMDDLVYSIHSDPQTQNPTPVQVMQQQNNDLHQQMTLDRQRQNSWQASLMGGSGMPQPQQQQQQHTHRGVPQQQLFAHVGYLNSSNPNSWPPVQATMDLSMTGDGGHHHHHGAHPDQSMPAVSTSTHSHLFW